MDEKPDYIIDLQAEYVPIDHIIPDPANSLDHTDKDLREIAASLSEFGQRTPLVVNRKSKVIEKGNGTWQAAKDYLEWEQIAVVWVDDDAATAIRYGIADNATGRIAVWDYENVLKLAASFEDPTEVIPGVSDAFMEEARQVVGLLEDEDDSGWNGQGNGSEENRATMLEIAQITIDDPQHEVQPGDIWRLGDHILVCTDVLTGWPMWKPFLKGEDVIFAPYPGVFTPLCVKAQTSRFILVQPDAYIAGHIIDRYADIYGIEAVQRD